jgi:hypothetical protein
MVESGMGAEVVGDKGKGKGKETGGEAMWAVMMVRELWKKKVWTDAKTVSIVSLAVFHPNTKVQSAAIHFFLGSDNDDGEPDSDEEDNDIGRARKDINAYQHKLNVGNTSSRKGAKMLKTLHKEAHRVRPALSLDHVYRLTSRDESTKQMVLERSPISPLSSFCTTPRRSARGYTRRFIDMVSYQESNRANDQTNSTRSSTRSSSCNSSLESWELTNYVS